ncbi:MAG: Arc family DNA-binding protein [Clostridiales bacterium]|nr:Arc family DNA-binding protein [Clostridiales bacterium]
MDNLVKRTIRIDSSVNNKIKYIAEMEGRSVNKEIELYLKKSIKAYE